MALTHVVLNSGRVIELSRLELSSTYSGMLEGYPFQGWNDRKVAGLVGRVEQEGDGVPVHLVEPVRELPDLPDGAFGPVELLPAVTCVGVFSSKPVDPELDAVLHHSALRVVWFQQSTELPSGTGANGCLRGIAWDDLARDFEL
ncbi:hypothetical protein ABT095_32405 [Kitasatospora sp. NPDC002227]|uniref:hypothetical protein n=1 Tax=Kitasatospora sp. NPDC002227 TaxID=3154773 RepID=UPI00332BC25B